jgi:hypothetical protein
VSGKIIVIEKGLRKIEMRRVYMTAKSSSSGSYGARISGFELMMICGQCRKGGGYSRDEVKDHCGGGGEEEIKDCGDVVHVVEFVGEPGHDCRGGKVRGTNGFEDMSVEPSVDFLEDCGD